VNAKRGAEGRRDCLYADAQGRLNGGKKSLFRKRKKHSASLASIEERRTKEKEWWLLEL